MESHRLVAEGGPRDAEWVLAWDDTTLTLDDADGLRVLEAPQDYAHRIIDLYALYAQGKISITNPEGALTFKKHALAATAVRALVETGLAGDPEFCTELRRESLWAIPLGLVMFVVGGGLLGLYCWYASWAPDPPPGHWMRSFGWAIHGALMVLLCVGLGGLSLAYFGMRQSLQVRRIARVAREIRGYSESGPTIDSAESDAL